LFPLIGLILYFVFRASTPLRARSVGRGALLGFGLQVVATILMLIVLGRPVARAASQNPGPERVTNSASLSLI
jgi:uncharacterized membrane protein (DUF485 family)